MACFEQVRLLIVNSLFYTKYFILYRMTVNSPLRVIRFG